MKLCVKALEVRIASLTVCRALNFTLAAGAVLGILGRNGAGKTTLINTLAGLRTPAAGEITLDGYTYAQLGLAAAAKIRGWLGQENQDPFANTVLDTVLAGRHPHLSRFAWESAADLAIAEQALEALGLAAMLARPMNSLSGGERRRAHIATLLAQQPQLYLLDEPLAHLDLKHQIAVLELFCTLAHQQNASVVIALHDPNFARRYCDNVLLLYDDGTCSFGSAQDVLNTENLSRLYGWPFLAIGENSATLPVFVPK